jgi:hypothetical protein
VCASALCGSHVISLFHRSASVAPATRSATHGPCLRDANWPSRMHECLRVSHRVCAIMQVVSRCGRKESCPADHARDVRINRQGRDAACGVTSTRLCARWSSAFDDDREI